MATFVTDAVLRAAVTAANSHAAAPLPDHWDAIVPRANQWAFNTLRTVILGRGFTAAQFASWGSAATSDGYDWNQRLGVVEAFILAAKADPNALAAFRAERKELLEELMALPIIVDGLKVYPTGRIGTGEYDTSSDRFTLDDPDGSGDFSPPTDATVL